MGLGILAGKRDFLHFDQWLAERIRNGGQPFVHALLNYLETHVLNQVINNRPGQSSGNTEPTNSYGNVNEELLEKSQLTLETLGIIFENLLQSLNN